MENIRSPFENIFNIINGLPQGHEKPLKHALYNALALFLLFLCCAAGWALYLILEPFIKPLIWALLVGSVLHPFKYNLATKFQRFFNQLDEASRPVFVGLLMLPVNIVNDTSEFIGDKLLKHIKIIAAICITIPALHIIYYYTPRICICLLWKIIYLFSATISCLIEIHNTSLVLLLLIGYVSLVALYWKPEVARQFHYAGLASWLLFSCYIAHFTTPYQVIVFVSLQLLLLAGFISEVLDLQEQLKEDGKELSFIQALVQTFINSTVIEPSKEDSKPQKSEIKELASDKRDVEKEDNKDIKAVSTIATSKTPWTLELFESPSTNDKQENSQIEEEKNDQVPNLAQRGISDSSISTRPNTMLTPAQGGSTRRHTITSTFHPIPRPFIEQHLLSRLRRSSTSIAASVTSIDENAFSSDLYVYCVLWACGLMLVWKHVVLLPILPIPILIYVIKHTGTYLGLWNWLRTHFNGAYEQIKIWCIKRQDALTPVHVRGLYKIAVKINHGIESSLKDSIDTVSSVAVIFGLIIFLTCASVFIIFQIYAEAIMLVQMTSNVINSTVVHNPELRQLLPPGWDDTVDSLLDNAYQYGRDGISKLLRSIMNDVDESKVVKLENQVLELFDRIYQNWVSGGENGSVGPQVTAAAVQTSWEAFINDIKKSPEMFNIAGMVDFLKQNVGTLMTLLESVWAILIGNISLVLGSFSAFVSVLLGGGTAVLNFILNTIVFLTTLFYLLCASGELYKPVALVTSVSPYTGGRFSLAFEQAISGVFRASGKMAIFYGLWTWLIHNLFGVKIVYLPSALAMVLGAVPFLGTYWACLPAVLDLWLAQGHAALACLLAVFQFLPCTCVDTAIYQEIKGGAHPYLTGLAIAGGIFCLGVEGAIVGPLLLCGLFVVVDLSSSFFRETPSDETLPLPINRFQRIENVINSKKSIQTQA